MYAIGGVYEDGEGVEIIYYKAFEWYQKSAIKGNKNAMSALGSFYLNGDGVTKDLNKAKEW